MRLQNPRPSWGIKWNLPSDFRSILLGYNIRSVGDTQYMYKKMDHPHPKFILVSLSTLENLFSSFPV
ncbi:uncharacterized protein RCC_09661 [Ramularia collo-cygni]|uniref:Uncharacterized protein n=1 Tax=Ramularia collo-cygni TaxID=112498 RepID=A0A2D3VDT1_9PEZI|nr:uncharacterized protein RCC_09661 [Ramularia collo-cygni]CZT23945.1 uncharacterized protein RCC_09661 [Ramularia collo-cygni]